MIKWVGVRRPAIWRQPNRGPPPRHHPPLKYRHLVVGLLQLPVGRRPIAQMSKLPLTLSLHLKFEFEGVYHILFDLNYFNNIDEDNFFFSLFHFYLKIFSFLFIYLLLVFFFFFDISTACLNILHNYILKIFKI